MDNYNKVLNFWFSNKTKKIWLYNHKQVYKNIKKKRYCLYN